MNSVPRRVGDVQRCEHAEMLANAFAKGELSRMELDARTELCLTAVTEFDLARLVADLPEQTATLSASSEAGRNASRGPARLAMFVAFQVVLIVVAYTLGVDLESEMRSWDLIAMEIWGIGMVAGAAGALLLRPIRHSLSRH